MTNTTDNTATYYDLHTTGAGFLNRCREVKPKAGAGNKFKPFWSVNIGAFRGNSENVEYTNFDCKITGTKALEVIQEFKDRINDQESKVICGFVISDTYAYTYETVDKSSNEKVWRAGIKGRLIQLKFIKIDGEIVYKHEKPVSDDNDESVNPSDGSVANDSDTDSQTDCPFDEQLGNEVTLSKDDPDFDKKKDWLKEAGYKWNSESKNWELPSK